MRMSAKVTSTLSAAHTIENPFSIHRAEHLGRDLYRYFAKPELFTGRLGAKSLVILGGRGCGKTMFFIYHTYESKRREYQDQASGHSLVLEQANIFGVYVHAKSDLVTAFMHRNLTDEEWTRIFGHYFNVVAGEQIARIGHDIGQSYSLDPLLEQRICEEASYLLDLSPVVGSYEELANRLHRTELEILRYVGNPSRFPEPVLTICGGLPKLLAEGLTRDPLLDSKVFHIFVDEYENLLEYQQRVINTLIKTPSAHLVVDIGLRKEGWKTRATLAQGESISDPHDFRVFECEVDLTSDQYAGLLVEICRKRLQNFGVPAGGPSFDSHSIRNYLGEYDLHEEVELMLAKKDTTRLPYKAGMKAFLRERVAQDRRGIALYQRLGNGSSEIVNRLNYCLLLQGKEPALLDRELEKYENGQASRYDDWLHNYELGVVFLLCRDVGVNKRYWGFSTFCLVSSGVIRYFLELCETSFVIASRRGFSFSKPRGLTIQEQDSAAQAVSGRKVEEVDSYTPHGMYLKNMVSVLGAVFESLHEDPKVSEPERNHFTTRPEDLTDNARSVLRSAILWNVLQGRPVTKEKAPSQIGTEMEYHLNHIYSPFFQISYRRKKSLYIRSVLLERILTKNLQEAKAAARSILSRRSIAPVEQLEVEGGLRGIQTELWIRKFDREE